MLLPQQNLSGPILTRTDWMLCNQSPLFVITALNKQIIDPQKAGSTLSDILLLRGTKTPRPVPGRLDQTYRRLPGSIFIEERGEMIKNKSPL